MKKAKIKIILQARCGSKRFPYKSIYPIKNMPLAIFCAKRLNYKNKYDLVIATSNNKNDDYLTSIAKKYKINFFRGSENNVLKRFLDISKNFKNDDIIVRATADNPLPDFHFLEKCIKIFKKYKLNYFLSDYKYFGLPYGLNLEILNVKMLRKQVPNKLNKEHVTFSLRKKIKLNKIKDKFVNTDFSNLNYSIDYVHDYILIKKKFEKFKLKDSWKKIIKNDKNKK